MLLYGPKGILYRGMLFTLWRRVVGSNTIRVWITPPHVWLSNHVPEETGGINLSRAAAPPPFPLYFICCLYFQVYFGVEWRVSMAGVCMCAWGRARGARRDVSVLLHLFHVYLFPFLSVCAGWVVLGGRVYICICVTYVCFLCACVLGDGWCMGRV